MSQMSFSVPSPSSLMTGATYLLLLAFCKAPPLSEHKQQFYRKRGKTRQSTAQKTKQQTKIAKIALQLYCKWEVKYINSREASISNCKHSTSCFHAAKCV